MKDRPTMWTDIKGIDGLSRYTSKNPKFRVVAMVLACVVMIIFVFIIALFLPRSSTVMVTIYSIPDGATVLINGKEHSVTPLKLAITPGKIKFELLKQGFFNIEEDVTVERNNQSISFTLFPSDGATLIETNPKSSLVYVDDKFVGYSPLTVKNVKGTHRVRASFQGFVQQEKIIDFGLTNRVTIDLAPRNFKVEIDTIPQGGEIYINEKHQGVTPWIGYLDTGTYKIRLAKEGHPMIFKEIKIAEDFRNIYSFGSHDLTLEGKVGNYEAPKGQSYLCMPKDGIISTKTPPLYLGLPPVTVDLNLVASYLHMEEVRPEFGLLISNHSLYGSSINRVELDDKGNVLTKQIIFNYPGFNTQQVIGQQLENIDFETLSSEKLKRVQLIDDDGNPRFYMRSEIGSYFIIDRDQTPIKRLKLVGRAERSIASPNGNYIAYLFKGKIYLVDIQKEKEITSAFGSELAFTNDSTKLLVLNNGRISIIDTESSRVSNYPCHKTGYLIPLSSEIFAITDKDSIKALWSIEKSKEITFSEVFGSFFWKDHFEGDSLMIHSIQEQTKTLVLGRIYGLPVIITLDPIPSIIWTYIPENIIYNLKGQY